MVNNLELAYSDNRIDFTPNWTANANDKSAIYR